MKYVLCIIFLYDLVWFLAKYGEHISKHQADNLFRRMKRRVDENPAPPFTVQDIVDELRKMGDDVRLAVKQDGSELAGVCFTSEKLIEQFHRYPEVVQMDGTHGVEVSRFALYHILVQNAQGHGQSVFFAFLRHEFASTIKWAVEIFRKWMGVRARSIRTVLLDKDQKERRAWESVFTDVDLRLLLCLVHARRTFKDHFAVLGEDGRMRAMALIEKCMMSPVEGDYIRAMGSLQTEYPEVAQYVEQNWVSCVEMWAGFARQSAVTFGDKDTNRIESANKYIQKAVHHRTQLTVSVRKILHHCEGYADECMFLINRDLAQRTQFHGQDIYQPYLDTLTSYASKRLSLELQNNASAILSESLESCACRYFVRELAPCRHMLNRAVRFSVNPRDLFPTCRWRLPVRPASGTGNSSTSQGGAAVEIVTTPVGDAMERLGRCGYVDANLSPFIDQWKMIGSNKLRTLIPAVRTVAHALTERCARGEDLAELVRQSGSMEARMEPLPPLLPDPPVEDTASRKAFLPNSSRRKQDLSGIPSTSQGLITWNDGGESVDVGHDELPCLSIFPFRGNPRRRLVTARRRRREDLNR